MKQLTGKQLFTLVVVALAVSLAVVAASQASRPAPQAAKKAEQVRRGEYLVTIGGCNDCHTPWVNGQPDMTRTLSGHPQQFPIAQPAKIQSDRWGVAIAPTNTAYSGPWGVSFAANLTPDKETGIGIWTFDIFKNTIRNGRHWGVARPLNPPMPWFNYRHMTDDDLAAVFAYLQSLEPVRNEVPQPLPPAPASTAVAAIK